MNPQESRDLIKNTFENDFDRDRFHTFIDRLLKNADFSKQFPLAGNRVFKVAQDKVVSFERIAQFTDVDGNKVDILIVNLRRESAIERARTSLRNFAAEYLKSDRGIGKAAVLAAYAVKEPNGGYVPRTEWRFSFVTLETELVKQESGKFKDKISRLTPAKRFSFLVGREQETHTAQKQFVDLIQSQSSPTLKQIEEAFSVEKVTKDFYEEYEKLFKGVKKEVNALRDNNHSLDKYFKDNFIETADFAKKLLGQIVFLYFLQRKGWFGVPPDGKWGEGDKRYLRKLFNDRNKIAQSYSSYKRKSQSFFHNVLEPLFYEALAYEHPNDVFKLFNAKVPFLNGGLFEPSYEYNKIFIDLPDELFSNRDLVRGEEDAKGILDIFDRYNFTVNEAERLEKEVAIDPEMLGHVFENLLVKEERGQSGTYYTPQVIVSYMCRQSLQNYLATHLLDETEQLSTAGDQLILEDLKDFLLYAEVYAEHEASPTGAHEDKRFPKSIRIAAPEIDRLLREVKICDPAIGSGAFPVGLLHEIVRLRRALVPLWRDKSQSELEREYSTYALKRNAIENSIYGVDIDQGAVDIARLRLWLSLIVDEDDLKDDKTLPNLDYKIMQGNSLLDEYEGLTLIPKDFVRRETPKSVAAQDEDKALFQKLSAEYVEEGLRGNKRSINAVRLLRDIEEIKRRIDRSNTKPDSELQSNLLEAPSQTAALLDHLNEIHQRIINEEDKAEKNSLRLEAERLLLNYINTYLNEREADIEAQIASTEGKLKAEITNVRRGLKKDTETVEIVRLRRLLSRQEMELKEFVHKRLELKKFWSVKHSSSGKDTDLTKIEIPDNITFRIRPFFLWELQFGDVFRRNGVTDPLQQGFDIVIANPPYIRHEKIRKYKAALQRSYPQVYSGTADILVYFYAKAFNILRTRGTLTFITSNKYFRAAYGEKLRSYLGRQGTITQVIDFGDAPVFAAAAYASIVVLAKSDPSVFNETRVWTFPQNENVEDFEDGFARLGFNLSQHELMPSGWRLESPATLRLLERLRTKGKPLNEYVGSRVYRGVTTGLNEAFVVEGSERDQLIRNDRSSSEILKPYLRGRDIERWIIRSSGLYLIKIESSENKKHPWSGKKSKQAEAIFAATYPAIYKRFQTFRKALVDRDDQGHYFWELRSCKYWDEFDEPKLVSTKISIRPTFMLDLQERVLGNTGYFLPSTSDSRYVLALLNSSVFHFYAKKVFVEKQNGWFEIQPGGLEDFPIPDADDSQKSTIMKFVDYILFLKTGAIDDSLKSVITDYFETIINALVYELFFSEELHAADKRVFGPLASESLRLLSGDASQDFRFIQQLFKSLSDVNHLVRKNLYFLDNLEIIRIIEGK